MKECVGRLHRALWLAAALLTLPASALAVPAAPGVQTLTQSDGTTFRAVTWGDEDFHGRETAEGYPVVFDESRRDWLYATPDAAGNLVSSGSVVGRQPPPPGARPARPRRPVRGAAPLRTTAGEVAGAVPQRLRAPGGPLSSSDGAPPPPVTDNVPVILVNFNDRTATSVAADFDQMLFGAAGYTMKTYYEEVSYGRFSVSAGPGGVAGWYTASKPHDYYGANDATGSDRWPGDLVYEAVAAADATFDFAPYDQDGDCSVDAVNIVHQGTGEEASPRASDIWSHRWNLRSAKLANYSTHGVYTTDDACPAGGFITVNDYVIQPEKLDSGLSTVGVFAHEFGHVLGLPDLYDRDGNSEGIGRWSLMASGSWNGVVAGGDRPSHLDAWCKRRLGWVSPQPVRGRLAGEAIAAAACAAPCAGDVYLLPDGAGGGEYFLVENRQQLLFDAALPGAGLLVWHVDEARASNDGQCYPPANCATTHYRVALVQADNQWHLEKNANRGDAGDPYPGSTGAHALHAGTSPSSKYYSGAPSSVSLTDIGAPGDPMTATLEALLCADPGPPVAPATSSTGAYTVSWGASATGGVGYTLEEATDGDFATGLRTAYTGSATSAPIADRPGGSTYYYRVRATRSGYVDSGWATGASGCFVPVVPPGGFSKTAPGDGSALVDPDPQLTWSASPGAAAYEYCVDATDDGVCSDSWVGAGTALSASPGLALGATYFWQVRAVNDSGVPTLADGGAWWRFTTRYPASASGWEHIVGGANGVPDEGTDVAARDGASFVAGTLDGGARAWVGRFRGDGSADWERSWAGTASALATAPDGSVYVTGKSGPRAYLKKIAPDGATEAWTKALPGRGRGVAVGIDDGSVFLVGSGSGAALIERRTADGALRWRRYVNGSAGAADEAAGAAVDAAGNLYVVGTLRVRGRGANIWLAKYSAAGRRLWSRVVGSAGRHDDRGSAVAVDAAGVFVTGTLWGGGKNQAWAARYTQAGVRVWSRARDAAEFVGLRTADLALAADGTLTVAGTAAAADGTERGCLWRFGQADGTLLAEDLRHPVGETSSSFAGIATLGAGFVVTGRRAASPSDTDVLLVGYE